MSHQAHDVLDIPLNSVAVAPDLWPRHDLDESRVGEFVTLYTDGGLGALPPLDVVRDGERLLLADGWHRWHALRALRASTARVHILPAEGDPADVAYRHGLLTAATSALPLSRAERRAAVRRLLTEHADWSDREIARHAGVSPSTVGVHRRQLTEPTAAGPAEAGDTYRAAVTADDLAWRLVKGLDKVWEARGLTDRLIGDRTGKRLARALSDYYGEDAAAWAARLHGWTGDALTQLREA